MTAGRAKTFLSGQMIEYVAFMRAINVAGHTRVKMNVLKETFASAGCQSVRTYIQSGNVIFESPEENTTAIFEKIRTKLRQPLGEEPVVFFRTVHEVERIVKGTPFRDFEAEPDTKLYVTFLSQKPPGQPQFPLLSSKEALEAIAMKNLEVFIVSRQKKKGFYGFPNNFIEKELRVSATTRNWSTLTKLVEFVRNERA